MRCYQLAYGCTAQHHDGAGEIPLHTQTKQVGINQQTTEDMLP